MPQKLHLCLLTLVSIFLLFVVSTLNTTAGNANPAFVYAQSATTPEPLPSIALEALQAIWQAQGYWTNLPDPARIARTAPVGAAAGNRQAAPAVETQTRVLWVDINAAAGGDGAEATPFNTIQSAIDAAVAGELIVVRPGIYASAPVVMKDGVDVIGAVEGDPTQVTIQSNGDAGVLCANSSLLQDIKVVATVAANEAVIRCSNKNPLFNRILVDQPERIAIQLIAATGAVIANSQFNTVGLFLEGNTVVGGNLILGGLNFNPTGPLSDAQVLAEANLIVGFIQVTDLKPGATGSALINNWVIGSSNLLAGPGINLAGGQTGSQLLLANNTVLGHQTGIVLGGGSSLRLLNNIIGYNNTGITNVTASSNLPITKNIFWSNGVNVQNLTNPIGRNGNLQTDPRFVDLAQGNFHLAANSPAIDTGQTLVEVAHDIDFDIRPCDGNRDRIFNYDIGADEYTTSASGNCLAPTPTPIPTNTFTPTPTRTPTATRTPAPTATATRTRTPTATRTPTKTATATRTPTATRTLVPTRTPTATRTPVAPPATATPMVPTPVLSPTPTRTPGGPNCQQLLVNPGFEERTGWVLPATTFSAVYSGEQIFAGGSSLRLGIPAGSANRVSYSTGYQWITLPANAKQITLQTQLWRSSASADSDFQYLWITVSGGATYRVFQGRINTQAWEPISYDLSALKGKRVQLLFGIYNNGAGGRSLMYVDEVALQACL